MPETNESRPWKQWDYMRSGDNRWTLYSGNEDKIAVVHDAGIAYMIVEAVNAHADLLAASLHAQTERKVGLADAAKRLVEQGIRLHHLTEERDALRAALGAVLSYVKPCFDCDGTGLEQQEDDSACAFCGGTGEIIRNAVTADAIPQVRAALALCEKPSLTPAAH